MTVCCHLDSILSIWYATAMESTGKPNDPLSRFALSILDQRVVLRTGDRLTRSIGQNSARWQVLGRVGDQPQTVAQIARDMGHARQSVSVLQTFWQKKVWLLTRITRQTGGHRCLS